MSAFPRGSAPTASPPAAKAGIEVDDLIAVLRTRFNAIEAPRVAGLLSTQGASGQLAMLARAGRQEVGPLVARTMMELPGLASDALVAAPRGSSRCWPGRAVRRSARSWPAR